MRIDNTNKYEVMQLLKEGRTLYMKSCRSPAAVTWKTALSGKSVIYDDQQGFKCESDVSACVRNNFWGHVLCNEYGEQVSLEYYKQEVAAEANSDITATSTLHPHYDMIVRWASDPEEYRVQWKNCSGVWVDVDHPVWRGKDEYRFKPVGQLKRQAIFRIAGEKPHILSIDFYVSEEEFKSVYSSLDVTFIAWYEATAHRE